MGEELFDDFDVTPRVVVAVVSAVSLVVVRRGASLC